MFVVSWYHGTAEPFAEADELRPEKRAVFKLKETDAVFRCSSEHRPDRGQKLRDDNLRRGFAARRATTTGERFVHFPDGGLRGGDRHIRKSRVTEIIVDDELKKRWELLEAELRTAMGRLSEAIEKARAEMPAAAKAINDEYLRVQEKLDKAVEKLRN